MANRGIQGSGTCCQSWELTLCIFVRLNISRHTSFLRHHTDPLTFGKQVKQALTHRLALGAFRPDEADDDAWVVLSQCTFWCSVLSDRSSSTCPRSTKTSPNAPSGAWCFPTEKKATRGLTSSPCLNAPSGAWCFPTPIGLHHEHNQRRLNAPSGARCFPT